MVDSLATSVPRDPVLQETATIRDNIDPFRRGSEDRIVSILQEVGLWNAVQEKGGLYAIVDAKTFSSGQKQILCMARAILQPGALVLLDECTRRYFVLQYTADLEMLRRMHCSADQSTSNIINHLVHPCFGQQTVIATIHRLETSTASWSWSMACLSRTAARGSSFLSQGPYVTSSVPKETSLL